MAANPSATRPGRRRARLLLESRLVTALAEPHGVDRYLGLVNRLWSLHEVRAVVTGLTHPTEDSVTLTLRPNGNWRGTQAGQYVRLTIEIDGRRRTRCFSVASSAERADGLIEITAKVNPGGTVSRYLKRSAAPGFVVELSQAEGDFVLPADPPEHILLISGGSGITAVMSILRTLRDRRADVRITFIHYARTAVDVIYRAELAALRRSVPGLTLAYFHTRQPPHSVPTRYFSKQHLLAVAPDYAEALTYVCGPASLLDAVTGLWQDERLDDRLRVERFTLATPAPHTHPASGTVRFGASGLTVPNDGRTLLEQAEGAGLRPEHGCRMGICHTCVTRKRAGSVRNAISGAVTSEQDEPIQLCICTPCGDVELDL